MKIEFDRDLLVRALQKIGNVVERKTTMPILGNVLVETQGKNLRLTATDLETTIQSECPVKVAEEGIVCIPARNLLDIVRELPERSGRLTKKENDWLLMESGKARFKVVGAPSEKFPKMASTDQFKFMKVRAESIRSGLDKTFFAISVDEMRYNLNGAFLETTQDTKGRDVLRIVTTDGHRLALNDHELSDDETIRCKKGVILPRKGVAELRRLLAEVEKPVIEIAVGENYAAFRFDDTTILMRLVVGEFPDYNAVVPKENKKKLRVDRNLFTHSLKRVSLLSEGKSKCVKLGLKGNGVHLAATSPELGEAEEQLPAEFEGGELEIGFNARYLLDILGVSEGDKIFLELNEDTSPGIVRSSGDVGFLGVIMPMRI